MKCQSCGADNLPSAKFCKNCGARISNDYDSRNHSTTRMFPFLNKKNATILAIILLIGGISWLGYNYSQKKKNLSLSYLTELSVESENVEKEMDNVMDGGMKSSQIDEVISKVAKLTKKFKTATNYFYDHANGADFDDDSELQSFVEIDALLEKIAIGDSDCGSGVASSMTMIYAEAGLKKNQIESLTKINKDFCEASRTLNKISVQKKGDRIKASYDERESENIPSGYSITAQEPEDGEKSTVVITVDKENRGTGNVITKQPKNGIKVVGKGKKVEIAKKAESKLGEITALWNNQTFSASAIEPFLDSENKDKAGDLEDLYKKVIFNWKRFEKVNAKTNDVEFDEDGYSFSNKATGMTLGLPVEVAGYSDSYSNSLPIVPFFYEAASDSWVSSGDTLTTLFDIVAKEKIKADISPKDFKYSGDSCNTGWFSSSNKEVSLKEGGIMGDNNLYLESENYSSFSKISIVADGFDSKSNIKGSNSSLDSDLVYFVNTGKKTVLTVKSIEKDDGDCKSDKDIVMTFFK